MNVARILGFVAAGLAALERAPGAGDIAALDALGLVEAPEVGLGHVEGRGGDGRRLLRRPIAVGVGGRGGRGGSGSSGSRGRRVTNRRRRHLGAGGSGSGSGSGGLHVRHGGSSVQPTPRNFWGGENKPRPAGTPDRPRAQPPIAEGGEDGEEGGASRRWRTGKSVGVAPRRRRAAAGGGDGGGGRVGERNRRGVEGDKG